MEELMGYIKAVPAIVPVSKSAAAIVPVEVDARNFERACFLISTGAFGAGATFACKAQEAATSGGTLADITSAALTNLTTSGASKLYCLEMKVNADKPYIKLSGTAGTAAVLHSAVCLLYGGSRTYPVTSGLTQYVRR